VTRTCQATGEALLAPARKSLEQTRSYNRVNGKSIDGDRVADSGTQASIARRCDSLRPSVPAGTVSESRAKLKQRPWLQLLRTQFAEPKRGTKTRRGVTFRTEVSATGNGATLCHQVSDPPLAAPLASGPYKQLGSDCEERKRDEPAFASTSPTTAVAATRAANSTSGGRRCHRHDSRPSIT